MRGEIKGESLLEGEVEGVAPSKESRIKKYEEIDANWLPKKPRLPY